MFERYTEKARRVVFFARYEASMFGSRSIETEHLLLGLLRESGEFVLKLAPRASKEDVRRKIEETVGVREKVSTSVDLPLSNECRRILAFAGEETNRLSHRYTGPEHILLGILREKDCLAARVLGDLGLQPDPLREKLAREGPERDVTGPAPEMVVADMLQEFQREPGGASDGHHSTRRKEADGTIVVESVHLCSGHRILLTERLRLDDDGKTLSYSVEIVGPKPEQQHKHAMQFDVS